MLLHCGLRRIFRQAGALIAGALNWRICR